MGYSRRHDNEEYDNFITVIANNFDVIAGYVNSFFLLFILFPSLIELQPSASEVEFKKRRLLADSVHFLSVGVKLQVLKYWPGRAMLQILYVSITNYSVSLNLSLYIACSLILCYFVFLSRLLLSPSNLFIRGDVPWRMQQTF